MRVREVALVVGTPRRYGREPGVEQLESAEQPVDALVWLVGTMLNDPKHFYRSYATQELARIMAAHPTTTTGVRAREMNLFRPEALGVLAVEIELVSPPSGA